VRVLLDLTCICINSASVNRRGKSAGYKIELGIATSKSFEVITIPGSKIFAPRSVAGVERVLDIAGIKVLSLGDYKGGQAGAGNDGRK
jgi:hypothetical protein